MCSTAKWHKNASFSLCRGALIVTEPQVQQSSQTWASKTQAWLQHMADMDLQYPGTFSESAAGQDHILSAQNQ